ncbi:MULTISPECIES: hypothetical protein [Streptomyces]|uniref:Uncharacterized protein n=1 Tax=Streptomyces venezuelae TaxID=54571 RepID=A0A5P2B3B3_STRVZ|nr:hypothetical protein [Streptomyces venezuelae]QES24228.1 hypothetical protein DEJ46_38305 [Streptomyces venezuelae]
MLEVDVVRAALTGPFSADGALALSLCGVRLDGRFAVRDTAGPVVPGDGSSITGPVTLVANVGGTALSGTTVDGLLRCEDNTSAPDLHSPSVRAPCSAAAVRTVPHQALRASFPPSGQLQLRAFFRSVLWTWERR